MNKLRKAFKNRKRVRLINPVQKPRYDEVYYRGVAWLDEG